MTPWEDIEKEPEFEALTPEDRASLFDEWKGGVLSAAADEDPETIDPVGINQFVATSNARRRSLLEGTPFDEAAALQEYQQSLQTTAQKQADLLRRFNEAETARFRVNDLTLAKGVGATDFIEQDTLDKPLEDARAAAKAIEDTFAPGQMEQAKAAREALRGERSAAVLDGEIVVDPALTLNSSEYRDAVKAADASPEAKARALAAFQQNKKQFLRASLSTLRAAGEAPLPGMTSFATWESELPPEEYRKPPEEKVANYLREMKDRGGFRKLTSAIGTALMQGGADVATQGIGVAAMASGSPELAEQASQVSQGAELMGEASRLEGDLSATGATTAAGVARMAVPIVPAIGAAALTGGGVPVAAAVAGLQTAGSQFPSTYSALREQGKTEEEALSAARGSALLSGTVTAALTAVGGATGIEGILRQGGQKVVRSRLIEALKAVPGGALKEIPEELTDELASQIIEQKTVTPDKPVSQIIDEFTAQAPDLALQVALLGGAGEAVGTFRGTEVTPPPAPTVATPPPAQPAAAPGTAAPDVAANVAEADMGMPQTAGTPVTLDGQSYTISIPPESTIAPETVAGFYDDPDTLRALADRGDIRLEQVITPAETVDTTPLNDNLAVSAALAPETVAAVAEATAEEPILPAAVTTAQETPVAPAESGGGSLGQSSIAAGGSIPAVTEPTVPQTSDVSSPEIEAAADPFAPVAEAVAPETGAEVSPTRPPASEQTFVETPDKKWGWEVTDQLGGEAYGSITDGTADIVGMRSAPVNKAYTEEGERLKRRGFLRTLVSTLRSKGARRLKVSMQSADTRKALARLVETGELTNPREMTGISVDEHPTLFDIPQPPTPPTNAPAPQIVETGVPAKPAKGTRRRKTPQASTGDQLPSPEGSVEQAPVITPLTAPLRPKFEAGETVTFKVNGQPVIGTIQRVSGGGNATVTYNWNGKKDQEIVLRTSEIQRPVLALAEAPNYKYTQEQNTRKAARFGIPTEPGVTVNAAPVITSALERIASDTATPPMLRAVARALQRQNYDGVDLRIEADGRRWYAGYYLNDNGITEIGLNLRNVGRGQLDAVSVFLHEALHHVTLAKIRDPQGEIETQAVEALDTLRKRIKAYAGMQQKATKFSYELGTVDEFITALFTRPDFQDFIAGIPDTFVPGTPGSKFRSVLSEIFRIIAQLVTGQRVQKGGMLDQAFASSLTLFETPQRAARGAGVDYSMAETEPVFTPDEARAILTKRFGKAVADKFVIEVMAPRRMGNREVEVDAELRGGTISLNLKFMDTEDILVQKAEHEMAHAVYSDKKVQDAWRDLSASMPPDVRQRITERMKQAGYDPRVLNEEVLVRFFEEVRATTPPSKWKAFMDAVIDAFRRFFGAAPDERTARLAAARIIAAGEAAVARGLDPSKQAFGQSIATQRDYAFQRNLTGEAAEMKNLATIRPWKETVRLAREIIEPYKKADTSKDKMAGRREALQRLMTDTSIDPTVRAAGFMQLALETDTLASVAKTPEQQAAYDDFSSIPATGYGVLESSIDPASVKFDSVSQMMEMGTEAGRMLNTFRLLAAMTPDGFIRKSERVRQKKVDEATEQQFGTTPQKLLELMWNETAKAERDAVEKAKKEIKRRSPEAIAKAAIDRLNEMLAGPPRPRGKPSEVSELLRKHLYNPVEGFTDKLVALGVEKETADALDAVAATVRADLAKLEEANAVERLTKSLKPKTRAAKSAIPRLMRVLLEAGKTGAFDSKAFNDALAEAFNFPPMTAEQDAEIRRMVAEINKLPMGAARVDKQQELQNYVAMVQGIPARDVLLSAWYANILSGISTQAIGLVGNTMNTFLRSAMVAITNPADFMAYVRGALGAGKDAGIAEVKAALQGRGQFKVGKLDDPQIANALEVLFRKGPTTPAEWVAYIASAATRLRYVFRVMSMIDAFYWNSAREGMYHLAASRTVRKMAKEQSMTKEEANAEFIRQLGGGPEVYEEELKAAEKALKDAGQPADMATMDRMAREAINRIREKENPEAVLAANRWADRMVLQQEPEGIGKLISALIRGIQGINVMGFPLGQMLVPFNKIVSNLFEQSLDYTGLGLVRGALGMHLSEARLDWSKGIIPGVSPAEGAKVFSDVERRERAMAGFVGLTLSAAAYLAAKSHMDDDDDEVPFMLYAFGPSDKNKREQMPAGWVPFSIKVGDTYYRYAEWPLGMVLAGFAAALDAERYGNMKEKDTMDRIGYSAMLGLKGFMTQGVLSNVDTAIDALMFKATGKKYTDIPVNAAKGLIPAQGFLRDISSLFDNTKVSNDDVMSALLRDVPFAKSLGTKPQLNVFGEPVEMEGEAILRRFLTQRRPHPAADYLTRNKLYIPGMAETVDVGDYLPASERDRFKRRAMQMAAMDNGVFTPEQNYAFRKRAGELTKSAVERIMKQAPAIRTEEQRKAVQNLIDKQVALARRRAMVEAVPYQPPPAQ